MELRVPEELKTKLSSALYLELLTLGSTTSCRLMELEYGIGGELRQTDASREEHPVAYYSQKLASREKTMPP